MSKRETEFKAAVAIWPVTGQGVKNTRLARIFPFCEIYGE